MTETYKKQKICIITTVDISLYWLFPDLYSLLSRNGYDVTGICADTSSGNLSQKVRDQGVHVINVPMTRTFTILQDIKCLWILYGIFRREKFDIIHYSTPKAAFLAAIAGRIAGWSYLLYTLRGLGYTAFVGVKRFIGKLCEKIACRFADQVIVISPSLRDEAVREKLLSSEKVMVLGAGSSKGIDLETFSVTNAVVHKSREIREKFGIPDDGIVIGTAGRLTVEKGIKELLEAFRRLCKSHSNLYLFIIGSQDHRNPLSQDILDQINNTANVFLTGYVIEIENYLAALDIFVLPSYREGFGNVIIEASAMGKPVIASDIPGCRDAVKNGISGLLVPPKDASSLEKSLNELITDPIKRSQMSQNGVRWVKENFDRKFVWNNLLKVYQKVLAEKGLYILTDKVISDKKQKTIK
jgi:glycosyltransferase involved in cell wall biosynthesis